MHNSKCRGFVEEGGAWLCLEKRTNPDIDEIPETVTVLRSLRPDFGRDGGLAFKSKRGGWRLCECKERVLFPSTWVMVSYLTILFPVHVKPPSPQL